MHTRKTPPPTKAEIKAAEKLLARTVVGKNDPKPPKVAVKRNPASPPKRATPKTQPKKAAEPKAKRGAKKAGPKTAERFRSIAEYENAQKPKRPARQRKPK